MNKCLRARRRRVIPDCSRPLYYASRKITTSRGVGTGFFRRVHVHLFVYILYSCIIIYGLQSEDHVTNDHKLTNWACSQVKR